MAEIRFVEQSHEVLGWYGDCSYESEDDYPVNFIANVARTCYKSDVNDSKDPDLHSPYSDVRIEARCDANERLVRRLIANDHGAMLEHSFLSVSFVTDRAIANEIVRHRLFSFAQESSRYVNFGNKGFAFILPKELTGLPRFVIAQICKWSAMAYEMLTSTGVPPEYARCVLPLCTATKIVVSGNMREFRHALRLRTDSHAHPQMRELMGGLLAELKESIPVLFEDIGE